MSSERLKPCLRHFLLPLILPLLLPLNVGYELPSVQSGSRAARTMRATAPSTAGVVNLLARLPLAFEPNHGQTDPAVKFISRGRGSTLFLTANEAVLRIRHSSTESAALRMRLVGANPATQVSGLDALPGRSNYFLGNDPAKWRTDVPNFSRVEYRNVYPGVNLTFYGNPRELEYDFVVAPGADPRAITLAFEGSEEPKLDAQGNLILHTSAGEVIQDAPVIYQESDGVRRGVSGKYVPKGKNQVGFQVGEYDPNKPLIIDPVVLSYSTYLGGSGTDQGRGIALDAAGNIYVTGETNGLFPTANPFQATTRSISAFVTKFNAVGSALIYSTYLGGSDISAGNSIAVDAAGNPLVTGETRARDFPTLNALQAANSGGDKDVFVAKLNATGNALVFSTYLGGSDIDRGWSIAVDAAGNSYVTGVTNSTNFPTVNAIQPIFGGRSVVGSIGSQGDAFAVKFSPSGSAIYSTYLGGAGDDVGYGIAADATGNAYVAGSTLSCNFRTTPGAFQPNCDPFPGSDAFVTKLNPTGTAFVYSTFLAGAGEDFATGIAVDGAGNAYVAGSTNAINFPIVQPFQAFRRGSDLGQNAFVAKLNAAGSALTYSSYLGGGQVATLSSEPGGGATANGIAVDSSGNAYITGTGGTTFPIMNAFQGYLPATLSVFVSKVNSAGSALVYSTYLGGTNSQSPAAIAVDAGGNAYVVGRTNSPDFPTANPFQATYRGPTFGSGGDAFIAKVSAAPLPDNFTSPVVIDTTDNVSDTVETSSATTDASDPTPSCGNGSSAKSIWYRFTAPTDGTINADTVGSTYDTILSVWVGAPGAFNQVACNDDAATTRQSRVSFGVAAGSTYSFMVSAASNDGGTSVFNLAFQTPPVTNDTFAGTVVINQSPFTESVETSTATTETTDPTPRCPNNLPRGKTVWYRFTPTLSGMIHAHTFGSNYDTILSVWTGSPGSFSQIGCSDDARGELQSSVIFSATPGTAYYFMVSAFRNDGGKLSFSLWLEGTGAAPPNDNFADAMIVSGVPFTDTVNVVTATREVTDPALTCILQSFTPSRTIWYRYTPTRNITIRADTHGSDYHTVLTVLTGSPGAFSRVTCDSSSTGLSRLSFLAVAGTTYFFLVSTAGTPGDTSVFNLSEGGFTTNTTVDAAKEITTVPSTQREYATEALASRGTGLENPIAHCGSGSDVRDNSIWYRFTPTRDTPITADTFGSSNDTILSVWTGAPGALIPLACNDDAVGYQSRVSFPARAGTTYFFMLTFSRGGGTSFFNLTLQDATVVAPANEDFNTATSISVAPFAGNVNTQGASTSAGDPMPPCGNGSRAKSVWYRFTPPAAGTVVADTFGSGYDTLLSVWTGAPGSFAAVACNDNVAGAQSQVSFVAAAGTTYFFMVTAVNNDGGALVFTLAFLQGVTSPIPTGNVLTIVPHSAYGGGFLTRLFVSNLTNTANPITINRINQSGSVVSSTTATLAAAATLFLADADSQRSRSLTVEWFAIGSQGAVAASNLFDFDGAALTPPVSFRTAVGALSSPQLTSFTVPIRVATANVTVGVALANLSNQSNQIILKLLNANGALVATDTLTLSPFGQTAFSVHDRPAFASIVLTPAEFVGALLVTTQDPQRPVAAIGVGNNFSQLFSLPVTSGVSQ